MSAHSGVDPSGVTLVNFSASPDADGVVVLDTVINDDLAHRFLAYELDYVKVLAQFRRADELDSEAAYYGHASGKPPTSSPVDASLSCHRTARLNRSISHSPDRKDYQHDHGRQDQDPATAARRTAVK